MWRHAYWGDLCSDERAVELVHWAIFVDVNLSVGTDTQMDEIMV